MRRVIVLAAVGLVAALLATPAQAGKPSSTTNQVWTSTVTSIADGSTWLFINGDKIQQPGNSIWNIVWQKGDGPCLYYYGINGSAPYNYIGEWGVQTGSTWTSFEGEFAWVGTARQGYQARLALTPGVTYTQWLGLTWAQPLIDAGCTHGILYSLTTNKDAKVLDDYVPLSVAAA